MINSLTVVARVISNTLTFLRAQSSIARHQPWKYTLRPMPSFSTSSDSSPCNGAGDVWGEGGGGQGNTLCQKCTYHYYT